MGSSSSSTSSLGDGTTSAWRPVSECGLVRTFSRDETYTHEVPLAPERQTNVFFRTKEWWSHMKAAYVITWDTSAPVLGGSN